MPHARLYALFAAVIFIACSEPTEPILSGSPDLRAGKAAATSDPTVTSALPSSATVDTTLDVQINGTGFTTGAQATLQLAGVVDPRVRVNNTRFVKNTQVIANVTISPDARLASYDVVVTLVSGKKGIGTERFAVVSIEQLAGPAGSSAANDVNGSGLIVGGRAGGCDSHQLPAYWNGGGQPIDLPLLGPWCYGNAMFVNESSVIIGHMNYGASLVGVMWTPDGSGGYAVSDLAGVRVRRRVEPVLLIGGDDRRCGRHPAWLCARCGGVPHVPVDQPRRAVVARRRRS